VVTLSRRNRRSSTALPLLPPRGWHVEFEPQRASSISQPGVGTQTLLELSQSGAGSSPGFASQAPPPPSGLPGGVRRCGSSSQASAANARTPPAPARRSAVESVLGSIRRRLTRASLRQRDRPARLDERHELLHA